MAPLPVAHGKLYNFSNPSYLFWILKRGKLIQNMWKTTNIMVTTLNSMLNSFSFLEKEF